MKLTDQAPIFISYGRDDETADSVPRLHDDLESNGFNAWLDKHDILPGQDWDLAIQAALDSCRALVLVVTRKSLASQVVRAEWNRVLNAGKPVVPLMWGKEVSFDDLPFRLQLRQGINFQEDYLKGRAELFQFLRELPHSPTPADLSRARLDELKKAQERSDNPQHFEESIQEVQKRVEYEERRAENPEQVAQQEQASLQAGIERVQQQQIKQSEQRRAMQRIVGYAPQDVKNKFKDRNIERASLKTWFAGENIPLMVVVGHGGMGKTALSCYVMDELETDYEKVAGLIYLSTTIGGVNLEKVFLAVGNMTGHALIEAYNDAKTPLAERIQKLLDALRRDDDRCYILLLDNFETLQNTDDGTLQNPELQEFLTLMLQQRHPLKILVTTRVPMKIPVSARGRARELRLEKGLAENDALEFLRELGVRGDEHQLRELANRLHGYPRALEAAAAYLSDPFATLDDLLTRQDIFNIPVDENSDQKLIENMVRAALTTLEPDALRVMQALAVYDRPVPDVAVEYVLEPFQPVTVTRDQLKRLTRTHLITFDNGRYSLHPVDQTFAYHSIPPGSFADVPKKFRFRLRGSEENIAQAIPYTRTVLADRAADYFKTTRLARTKWKTILDLEPQLAEFDQRIKAEDYEAAARIMGDIDFHYLMLWGHSQRVLDMREQLIGKLRDSNLERVNYGHLGLVYQDLGMVQKSINFYEKALQNARDNNNKYDEGASLGNLGLAYSALGEVRRAIDYYEQALAIDREIGDKRGEGADLGNLGLAYRALGEVRRAIDYYEQALAIDRKIGNKRGEGNHLGNLGIAYRALGEVRRAIEYYEQALAIARDIGDKRGEGNHLGNLGLAYRALGEVRRAIDYYEQALAIDRKIGNKRGEGNRLGNLGIAYRALGEVRRAIEYYEQALAIDREIGDKRGEGNPLGNLGNAYHDLGEVRRAIDYYEQALAVRREIGDRQGESIDLENVGHALLAEGKLSEAVKHYQQAVQIADEIGFPQTQNYARWGLAKVYLIENKLSLAHSVIQEAAKFDVPENNHNVSTAKGIINLRQGNLAEARDAFQKAVQQAEGIIGKTAEYYEAWYAKGLALSGLAVCHVGAGAKDGAMDSDTLATPPSPSVTRPDFLSQSITAYHQARSIFAGAGVIKSELMLLDELRKCEGVSTTLDTVRHVLAGDDS